MCVVKPIYWCQVAVKESTVFIIGFQARSPGKLVLEKCEGFRKAFWKARHPTISSSVVAFSFHLQSFPASGSFQTSQVFTSGDQSTGVSASASVLPMNSQDRSPLGWTGWIFLLFKGLSRVFSNTSVQKHQFFGAQLSLWSNSHIHTRLLEKS